MTTSFVPQVPSTLIPLGVPNAMLSDIAGSCEPSQNASRLIPGTMGFRRQTMPPFHRTMGAVWYAPLLGNGPTWFHCVPSQRASPPTEAEPEWKNAPLAKSDTLSETTLQTPETNPGPKPCQTPSPSFQCAMLFRLKMNPLATSWPWCSVSE